jgi:hypothetical protein
MEFGSLEELAGYIGEKGVVLTKIFGDDMEIVVKGLSDSTAIASGTVETGETATEPKKRGRPAKGADPATAVAPPPLAVPAAPAAPAAPIDTTVTEKGIPAFLDRAANPATPPAPPAPPAPPIPPAAPPSGILAGKVIGELERRGSDDITKKALVEWLASPGYGLVMPTASFDETIAAVRLMQDDKLSAVATALAIA